MTEEGKSGENEDDQRLENEKLANELANELIDLANNKMGTGIHPIIIASAFRQAAANFTAFANAQSAEDPLAAEHITKEFLGMLKFYESRHRGEASPMTSLAQLVEQAKSE